jgi:hypothetical protein
MMLGTRRVRLCIDHGGLIALATNPRAILAVLTQHRF